MALNKHRTDLEDCVDKLLILFERLVKLRKKFRALLPTLKDMDTEKKNKILKRIAELKAKIWYDDMQQRLLKEPRLPKEPRLLKQLRLLKKG